MAEYHTPGGTTGGDHTYPGDSSSEDHSAFAEKYMAIRDRIMQDSAPDYVAYTTEWLDAWVEAGHYTQDQKQQALDEMNSLAGTSEFPATPNQWLVLLLDGYLTEMVNRYAAMSSDGVNTS
jgi:hypothetical protein